MAPKETIVFGRPFSTDPRTWKRHEITARTVSMEVLVLGLPRTGTSSMVQALKILDYHNIYHMHTCISNPLENEIWLRAIKAKWFGEGKPFERKEWDELLGDCMAVTDFPAAAFAVELIEAYPEAKVILNTRPIDAWFRSVDETIGQAYRSRSFDLLSVAGDPFFSRWWPMVKTMWAGFLGTVPCGRATLREYDLKRGFREHYATVSALVPPERLYVKDITEGWEGMCGFLGKPVPKVPYPKTNDRVEFGQAMGIMAKAGVVRLLRIAVNVLAVALVLGVAVWLLSVRLRRAGVQGRDL